MIRALLVVVLAAGGLAAWRLSKGQTEYSPRIPPRWVEPEDGIQPADPWTMGLATVPRETP